MSLDLKITEKAAKKALDLMLQEGKEDYALRVGVLGGGCAGFQYKLEWDDKRGPDDIVLEAHELTVYVNKHLQPFLAGVELDYLDGLDGSGFKFNNPNATESCGCGSSFGK